ncbi:uncharacterized transporter slc-17.2-like isoform X1 [Mizuhopecten yessoensis]|uniref:Sialin n=1 Tax=Mizuhopecten yessoensis TaxID=6573 RepID=A0A210PMJ4_MIZYE|nr:uncharacterized transporter slc-17.2-like isoform X1 [Mizuhopecten yessoensis]OWF37694.1 Sialin [Mizuhopecten yessoensis]
MPKSIENIPLLDDQKKKQYTFTLWQKYTSCRWQVGITAALAMSCSILLRLNMTMVVVCMTPGNLTLAVSQNGTEITIRDPYLNNYVYWDSTIEGLLISGYYIGQVFTSLVFGTFTGRISGRKFIFFLTSALIVVSFVTPALTFFSPYLVLATRVLIGIATGGLEPCGTQLLSNWAPLHERAQMMSITEQANSIGGIGNFILSGFICNIPVLGGWPFIFYIFSGINMVAMILWLFLVYDKPSKHPWIKPAEVDYINSHRTKSHDKPLVVPWFKMMTSGPVWACVLGYVTSGTLFMVMAVCLPLYIEQVLKFDVATNGLVSALAFVGRFLGALVFGYLSDWIFTKRLLSLITIRKTCHATGLLGSIPIILGISFLGQDDQRLAVVLMTLYWFTLTCMNSGFRVNPADIAPRFAGVICGMCVFLNSVVSLFVPMVVTALTPNGTADEWQIVFYGCVGVSVVGTVVFLVLASAKEQEWAKDPEMDKDVVIKVTGSNNHAFDVDSVCSQNSSYSFK